MNTVQLVGKIATDIQLQQFGQAGTDTAKTKATFLLAVGRPVRNAEPDWVRVETWGKQAQNLVRFNPGSTVKGTHCPRKAPAVSSK